MTVGDERSLYVFSYEAGESEALSTKSCKCDCKGQESTSKFGPVGSGSMVKGVDCMPGKSLITLSSLNILSSLISNDMRETV